MIREILFPTEPTRRLKTATPLSACTVPSPAKMKKGFPENGWHSEQAMTREEALRSYTTWGAYAGFEENLKGSIEAGKLADFVIIDRDLMNCPAEEIKDIQALETVVGGETVYQKA